MLFHNLGKPFWHTIRRKLHVHENVGLTLMNDLGIPVPKFALAKTPDEAFEVAQMLQAENGLEDFVIKAQVLTGGRGKGVWLNEGLKGGVKLVFSPEEVRTTAAKMIGNYLITKQTNERGLKCSSVLVCERKYQRKEYYISLMMEQSFNGPVVVASSMGGINIEEVAKEYPDAVLKIPINILSGMNPGQASDIADKIEVSPRNKQTAVEILLKLYELFVKYDLTLLEINPFAEVSTGELCCLDAKLNFDDSAEFRQKHFFSMRDLSQEDEKEVAASQCHLNYITLDGNIGCLVNGAGLAMATMDVIKYHGGEPANFLDVGGAANVNQVKEAFRIITSDPKGTNVEDAKALIAASTLKIIACDNVDEAATVAVKASNIVTLAKDAKLSVKLDMLML